MSDSLPPPSSTGGNKGILVLLGGGFALLVIAAVVFFMRSSSQKPTAPTEPPKLAAASLDIPTPLVTHVNEEPLNAPPAVDTATPTIVEEKPKAQVQEKMGTIDPKVVQSFMNARFSDVKACYERRLKTNPLLEGALDLNIAISSSGNVKSVTVSKDTVRDATMLDCVRKTIRSWDFPKPEGGMVVVAKAFSFKKAE